MTRKEELQAAQNALIGVQNHITEKLRSIYDELERIRIDEERREFDCECVRLNQDIGIWDMVMQEAVNREALGECCGRKVSQCFSAKRHCPVCKGTGKLERKTF